MIVSSVVIFVLVLGLLVFVHELGHFLTAKLVGIRVEEFAFGFPPRLVSVVKRGTRYSINGVPLGGYVRLLGEEGHSRDKRAYSQKPPLQRLLVIVAGVLMNFLVAWVLLTLWFGITIAHPPMNAVVVGQVLKNSAADQAGLITGDLVISADHARLTSANDLARFTKDHAGMPVQFVVRRFGKNVTKMIILRAAPAPLGIAPIDLGILPEGLVVWQAPWYAITELWGIIVTNIVFIGHVLASLGHGTTVEGEVSGPVGIYGFLSQMVSLGPLYLTRFVANLSLLIGFFNILPIPALDGGKALFVAAELVSRRKIVREHVERAIHFGGFVVLMGILVIITYHDIIRFVTRRL
ncbi:site-2 protease family protein [Candidatus Berkelbacteria bacterium]|nr:site-2 protease family protein [Candidatus Berkelbacteria bacterium]